jgi:arsenite methyltransferase
MVSEIAGRLFFILTIFTTTDIIIVESPSDLNVYMSTNEDGTAKGTANTCCKGETAFPGKCCSDAGCEGKHTATKSCRSSAETPKAPTRESSGGETAGCCFSAVENGKGVIVPADIGDLDLNKWAGSFKIYAVKP